MRKIQNIAIFGGAEAKPTSRLYHSVYNVAKLLGEKGYTIVNGGGPGVMLAATEGAEAGGGKTLTVTFDPKLAPGFEESYLENHPDQEIKTSNYIERMFTLMKHGDCYIIFNGGTGTISEFGTAWCLARLYYGHHKPFILYGDFWHDIVAAFSRNMLMRGNDLKVFKIVNSPFGVLEAIKSFDEETTLSDPIPSLVYMGPSTSQERAFMR